MVVTIANGRFRTLASIDSTHHLCLLPPTLNQKGLVKDFHQPYLFIYISRLMKTNLTNHPMVVNIHQRPLAQTI